MQIFCFAEYIGPYQDEDEVRGPSPNLRRNDNSYPILGVTEGSCSDDADSDIQDIPIINQGKTSICQYMCAKFQLDWIRILKILLEIKWSINTKLL